MKKSELREEIERLREEIERLNKYSGKLLKHLKNVQKETVAYTELDNGNYILSEHRDEYTFIFCPEVELSEVAGGKKATLLGIERNYSTYV